MIATVTKPARQPALLDVRAVAEILGCSQRHVYRLDETGRMPRRVRIGALVRWNRAVIEQWIADGCPAQKTTEDTRPGGKRT